MGLDRDKIYQCREGAFFHPRQAERSPPAPPMISKIRVGMLGAGHSHFAGKLKAMTDSPDYKVVGVTENDAALRARAEKDPRYAGVSWIAEDRLLGAPSIHLVVVECRIWEALAWGKKVIAAGKHLHLERPPGNAPFRELVEEARARSCFCRPVIFGDGIRAWWRRLTPREMDGWAKCLWCAAR